MRKRKKLRILIIIAVIVIASLCVLLYFMYDRGKKMEEKAAALQSELEANTQTVFVAKKTIERGSVLTNVGEEANVEQQVIYTGLESYNYITADDLGDIAIIDIASGTPIMYSMVTEVAIANDTRDYEVAAVNIATDQRANDVIDVRITFPDGSDYVVLAKKRLTALSLENSVFSIQLNEEEILRYTCAMVDAFTNTGARLYTTKYIEENIQEEAIPNYPVRDVTRNLIVSDPNVVTLAEETLNAQARLSLETRLGLLTEEELEAVNDGFGLTDTAKASALASINANYAAAQTNSTIVGPDEETESEDGSEESAEGSEEKEKTEGDSEPATIQSTNDIAESGSSSSTITNDTSTSSSSGSSTSPMSASTSTNGTSGQ